MTILCVIPWRNTVNIGKMVALKKKKTIIILRVEAGARQNLRGDTLSAAGGPRNGHTPANIPVTLIKVW